jgi:membrane-associated phospholipid phosphatase
LYWILALFVRNSPDNAFDLNMLDWVLDWDVEFLDRAAERVSWITDTEPRMVMAVAGILGIAVTGRYRFAGAIVFATAITALPTDWLDDMGGVLTGRERPNGAPFKAYPSGHTLGTVTQFGFSIYLAIRLGLPDWLLRAVVAVFAVLMVLVGPARLVRGVHWPTDVIGSYLLGAGSLIAAVLVFEIGERWLDRFRPSEP